MDVNSVLNLGLVLFKYLMLAFITILVGFGVFLWVSSIDEEVTIGEYHCFIIGSTKKEAYEVFLASSCSVKLENQVVLFSDELEKNKTPVVIHSNFNNEEYYLFEDKNEWNLFLDSAYFFDNIRLSFCDERLCKIWRRRSYLELP
ncbi:hypothetical protein [Rheinheimera sp. MM224]|uniref:hypothetical protein n=1 Tax=Rheinheimera sp. MM224 TaxID=3019969 RepID=UPI0021F87C78|nr:hypothetical protein [Rheinheimera sp. MM224]CAI3790890.1 hypothetical protein JAMGFMIE_00155 [Rheinheimera sp. MM224]